jgi:SAM-dependent methyltransferase
MTKRSAPTTARLAAGWLARRGRELADLQPGRHAPEPVPPRRLRARTGAPGRAEFAAGGRTAAAELAALLPDGFAAFASILDFGCGSARVLPHVAALAPEARCAGCDVDIAAIAWASAHHPELTFAHSGYESPLPFPDASFALVYSISVLSHLREDLQDRWLAELARVLVPGGVTLLSTHGPHAFEQFRTGAVRTNWCERSAFARGPLATGETMFVPYTRSFWNRGELPGVGAGYGLAFHGEGYIRERWSRWLTVERIAPSALTGWQDLVRCRRP